MTTKSKKGEINSSSLKLEGTLENINLKEFHFTKEYLEPLTQYLNIQDGYSLLKDSYLKIEKRRENVYSYISNNEYNISLSIKQTYHKDYEFSYFISY